MNSFFYPFDQLQHECENNNDDDDQLQNEKENNNEIHKSHQRKKDNTKIKTYSIDQLYTFLDDILTMIENGRTSIDSAKIVIKLNDIKDNTFKNSLLKAEHKNWFRKFLKKTSHAFVNDPSIICILSRIFFIIFPPKDDANSTLVYLLAKGFKSAQKIPNEEDDIQKVPTVFECSLMAIKIFELYAEQKYPLCYFDTFIRKVFQIVKNRKNNSDYLDFRPICISIISKSLTNSNYLYESLDPSSEQLYFLSFADDPASIYNGLKICKLMIEGPRQKFSNVQYDYFFRKTLESIIFLAHEEVITDKIIILITKISVKLKSVEFFYLMEPNDLLMNWISSLFFISQRYMCQKQIFSKYLYDCLLIIKNLIKFWLLPPNLLKIQSVPDFVKWKEDFVSLCLSFFLKHSSINKQLKLVDEIMSSGLFIEYLGKYFSKILNFHSIVHHQLKSHPGNKGNCILISIFASVLEEREFFPDIKPFKKNDMLTLDYIIKYFYRFRLEPPQELDDFLFTDAYSRVLNAFSETYLSKGRIFIDDKLMNSISLLYIRTLVNLQSNDPSKERLKRGIDAILSVPFFIVQQLSQRPEFVPTVSNLRFSFILNPSYKYLVEDLFDHLFSIQNQDINISLVSSIDPFLPSGDVSPNLFAILRSLLENSSDGDQNKMLDLIMPIITQSLGSQQIITEVAETIQTMSKTVFNQNCTSMSVKTVAYTKIILNLIQSLLEQILSAEPNEEETISEIILNSFSNILEFQPINLGVLSYYNDFCFFEVVDNFFKTLYSKDIRFFCNDQDFVNAFIRFISLFVDSKLDNKNLFNGVSPIFCHIYDLHRLNKNTLDKLSQTILELIDRSFAFEGLLFSVFKYKIIEGPNIPSFNKLAVLLSKFDFSNFNSLLQGKQSAFSDEGNELIEYILSSLNAEDFKLNTSFETDFEDFFEIVKPVLSLALFNEKNEMETEAEEENTFF